MPPCMPPGLYKQLATLRDLVSEYRQAESAGNTSASGPLIGPIIEALNLAGLQVSTWGERDREA